MAEDERVEWWDVVDGGTVKSGEVWVCSWVREIWKVIKLQLGSRWRLILLVVVVVVPANGRLV